MWDCRDAARQQTHSNKQPIDCAADCPMRTCVRTWALLCSRARVLSNAMPFLFLSSVFHRGVFGLFLACSGMNSLATDGLCSTRQQCVGGGTTAFSRTTYCTELLEVGRLLHACVLVVRVCACVCVAPAPWCIPWSLACMRGCCATHHCLWVPERCQGGGGGVRL